MFSHQSRRFIFAHFLVFSAIAVWALDSFAMSSAFDPETNEVRAKTWSEDWLYPLRTSGKPNVVENVEATPYHVRFGFESRSIGYNFVREDADANTLADYEYVPNTGSVISLQISDARSFGIGYAVHTSSDEDLAVYHESEAHDFRLEIPFESWQVAGFYTYYKGFTLEDQGRPILFSPNLTSQAVGVVATFVATPHRYSLPAIVGQSARQTGSGYSFLFSVGVKDERLRGDTNGLLASEMKMALASDEVVIQTDVFTVVPTVGYGGQYNFTKNVFFSGEFNMGVGYGRVTRDFGFRKERKDDAATLASLSLNYGYNGTTHFYGVRGQSANTTTKWGGVDLRSSITSSMLYYGLRF